MKRYIIFSCLIALMCSSCAVFYGNNYDNSKKVKNLQLGMSKDEAIAIMGNDYIIESSSFEEDGSLEIIKYYSNEIPYLLHFFNGELVVFNRYHSPQPPQLPEQKVVVQKEE